MNYRDLNVFWQLLVQELEVNINAPTTQYKHVWKVQRHCHETHLLPLSSSTRYSYPSKYREVFMYHNAMNQSTVNNLLIKARVVQIKGIFHLPHKCPQVTKFL